MIQSAGCETGFKDEMGLTCIISIVEYEFDLEEIEKSFDFGCRFENSQYLAKFVSGELLYACLRCNKFDADFNLIETDYLGGVHLRADHIKEDVLEAAKCAWEGANVRELCLKE